MFNILFPYISKSGINVNKLKVGDKVVVDTANSTYHITILEGCRVVVQGGKYFPTPTEELFAGCTLGANSIRLGWICPSLRMEFGTPLYRILTSPVKNAIVYVDNRSYNFHWDN